MDLASRIGGVRAPAAPASVAPEPVRRVDGPIEASRSQRGRPTMIGLDEVPAARPTMIGLDEVPAARPTLIGLEEAFTAPAATVAEPVNEGPAVDAPLPAAGRLAPTFGEMDLVVTPLATPDDWHHFELALRRVKGVGPLRIEYYRAGILKLRLPWSGTGRLADALMQMPGYRVGILGEGRNTLQIRVARA